jgi:F-type H+-transporting ATPase subunit delta
MTSQSVIARPYAEAAFSVAKQDNSIEEWSSDLQKIKAVCADQKITNLLLNPDLSYSDKTEMFMDLFKGEISDKASSFVKVCGDNKRLKNLPEIINFFNELALESLNKKNVHVSSPFQLEEKQIKKITSALEKRLDSEVVIDFDIDKSLIGGLKIAYEDQVLDMSIKRKLDLLQTQLRN